MTNDRMQRLRPTQAAEYLGLSPSTLAKMRCLRSDGPPYSKLGRAVVYSRGDLDTWAEARKRRSTSDTGAA